MADGKRKPKFEASFANVTSTAGKNFASFAEFRDTLPHSVSYLCIEILDSLGSDKNPNRP